MSFTFVGMWALHFCLFLYVCWTTRVLRPYSDWFDLIDVYLRAERTGGWIAYLFEPHSYHRILWLRLLLALDVKAFAGVGLPFVVVAALCVAGASWLLLNQVRSASGGGLRLPAVVLGAVLLFAPSTAIAVSVPANSTYVHTLLFAVLTIVLAERTGDAAQRTVDGRRLLALACACAAGFSNAVGLVLWPALAFLAWRKGEADRRWLLVVLAVGGVFGAAYVSGLRLEDSAGSLTTSSMLKAADYLLAYLGLPWVRANEIAGRVIGATFLAAAVYALLRKGGPGATGAERIAVGLILFSLGTAVLAALGRQDIAEAVTVPGRYTVLLIPLKIGLLMLALPWLERHWALRPGRVDAVLVLFLSAYLVQQLAVGYTLANAAEHLRTTITDFQEGRRTAEMTKLIHPDLNRAEAVSEEMRRRGIFHHPWLVPRER